MSQDLTTLSKQISGPKTSALINERWTSNLKGHCQKLILVFFIFRNGQISKVRNGAEMNKLRKYTCVCYYFKLLIVNG